MSENKIVFKRAAYVSLYRDDGHRASALDVVRKLQDTISELEKKVGLIWCFV